MKYGFVLGVAMVFGSVPCALAAGENAKEAKEEVYRLWNVDQMIKQAADNVSRRYNLNADQAERTREMMRDRVTEFLEENEEAIWPLVRDLARQQLTGKTFDASNPADLAAAKRIGEMALPIVAKAKQAIYDGNEEWGKILITDEQRQLHDYDLREMKGQFVQINKNFEAYKTGNPTTQLPMFPTHQPKADEPATPVRPPAGIEPAKPKEDRWDAYVRNFIKKYELDPGQKGSAESILRDMKERAVRYRASKADQYKAVEKKLKDSLGGDIKKRTAARREELALNKPIEGYFEELKARLDKIPTSAQRKKHDAKVNAKHGKRSSRAKAKTPPKTPKSPTADDN